MVIGIIVISADERSHISSCLDLSCVYRLSHIDEIGRW